MRQHTCSASGSPEVSRKPTNKSGKSSASYKSAKSMSKARTSRTLSARLRGAGGEEGKEEERLFEAMLGAPLPAADDEPAPRWTLPAAKVGASGFKAKDFSMLSADMFPTLTQPGVLLTEEASAGVPPQLREWWQLGGELHAQTKHLAGAAA